MNNQPVLKPQFWQDGAWWCYRATWGDAVICEGKSMSWKSAVLGCYGSASKFFAEENILTESALQELNSHITHLEKVIADE